MYLHRATTPHDASARITSYKGLRNHAKVMEVIEGMEVVEVMEVYGKMVGESQSFIKYN